MMIIGRTFQTRTVDNFILHFTFLILFIQSDMKGVGAQTYFKHYNSSQMKDINLKISEQKYIASLHLNIQIQCITIYLRLVTI